MRKRKIESENGEKFEDPWKILPKFDFKLAEFALDSKFF